KTRLRQEILRQNNKRSKKMRFVTFTGRSFYPFLSKFIDSVRKLDFDIAAVEIENDFFGRSVTVAGLLTGRDVLKNIEGKVERGDILLIPDVVMKEGENVFLDNVSLHDVEAVLGVKAEIIESTPKGLIDAICR
ncbi:MAG: DUF512 domain-containing protein, partial [Nitrospirae bacterium]|nr:DUF512 domain-containing protein [Nitrospirota bacterium]